MPQIISLALSSQKETTMHLLFLSSLTSLSPLTPPKRNDNATIVFIFFNFFISYNYPKKEKDYAQVTTCQD